MARQEFASGSTGALALQLNAQVLGGIGVDGAGRFDYLPVSAGTPTPAQSVFMLSSSFSGSAAKKPNLSIIGALNHLNATIAAESDVAGSDTEVQFNDGGSMGAEDDFVFAKATATLTVTKLGAYEQAGAVDFSEEAMTNVNIDSGAIDGVDIATSDITVGAGKTLTVSAGTLTTSAAQNLAIMQGAAADVDIGTFDLRASTMTADSLTSGRVPFASTNGLLIDDADFSFATDTLTVTKLGAYEQAGAVDFSEEAMTNVNIDSGAIDGVDIATSDITVGAGKTLTVSAGTLTTSAAQNLAIMQGAAADVDIGTFDLRASTMTADSLTSGRVPFASTNGLLIDDADFSFATDTLTVTKLGAYEQAGAVDFSEEAMTNVNIDSGAIDGAIIGANSAVAGTFTALSATSFGKAATTMTIVDGSTFDWSNASFSNLGEVTTVDINGGSIDGAIIGAASAAAATFTTSTATTGYNGPIGQGGSVAAGTFSTLQANSGIVNSGQLANTGAITGSAEVRIAGSTANGPASIKQATMRLSGTLVSTADDLSTVINSGSSTAKMYLNQIPHLMFQGVDTTGLLQNYRLQVSGGLLQINQVPINTQLT